MKGTLALKAKSVSIMGHPLTRTSGQGRQRGGNLLLVSTVAVRP